MCRRDRRQLTRKKNLVRQLPAHSRINLYHIENFPLRNESPRTGASPLSTQKKRKGTEGQGLTFLLTSLSCVLVSLWPNTGVITKGLGTTFGSSCIVLNWTRSNRHCQHSAGVLATVVVGLLRGRRPGAGWQKILSVRFFWCRNNNSGAPNVGIGTIICSTLPAQGTPSILPEVQALLGLGRKVFWFA